MFFFKKLSGLTNLSSVFAAVFTIDYRCWLENFNCMSCRTSYKAQKSKRRLRGKVKTSSFCINYAGCSESEVKEMCPKFAQTWISDPEFNELIKKSISSIISQSRDGMYTNFATTVHLHQISCEII